MAETVGTLLLEAVGLAAVASTAVVGSITVASLVGGAVLLGGAIGLQLLTAKRPSATGNLASTELPGPEAGHTPLKQAILSRTRGFGRCRLAGGYVLYEAKGSNSYDIMAFHHGRIAGIVGYYLHDDVVEIDSEGVVLEQGDGRYGSVNVRIETRLGLPTETAYARAVAGVPEIWTNDHRGDGLASALLHCDNGTIDSYTARFPRGLPALSIVADLAPLYDARDPAQSLADPSTWQVSSNPVVQLLECLTNADSGFDFDRAELIDPVIAALNAEADICDETVVKADGSVEPRYASNGTFLLDSDPIDTIAAILDVCDGWMGENGDGTLALKVGKYRPPAFTLKGEHIRGFTIRKGVTDEELVNEIAFTYTEPQADYKTLPGLPWRDQDSIDALGKRRSQPFALSWCQSHSQGRRLSKRKMAKLNPLFRGTLLTTFYGIQGMGERWIKVEAPEKSDDLADVVIEVLRMQIDFGKQLIQFDVISVNPNEIDAFDASTEEGERPEIPAKLVAPPPPVPAGLLAAFLPEGGLSKTIGVSINDPGRSDLTFQMRYRVSGSGAAFTVTGRQSTTNWPPFPPFYPPPAGSVFVKYLTSIPNTDPSNDYEVQLRAYAPSGSPSDWSAAVPLWHV